MGPITIYTTTWCPDCRYAKTFLRKRGTVYHEVNIEEDEAAEEIVLKANHGLCKVPTLEVAGHYFACISFDPEDLTSELNVPLNP